MVWSGQPAVTSGGGLSRSTTTAAVNARTENAITTSSLVTTGPTTRHAVRLLERGGLAPMVRAAGVTNPTPGDLSRAARSEASATRTGRDRPINGFTVLERNEDFVADVPIRGAGASKPRRPSGSK
jgi:hypothetical protein